VNRIPAARIQIQTPIFFRYRHPSFFAMSGSDQIDQIQTPIFSGGERAWSGGRNEITPA
jgi:hypothetical protein